MKKFNKERYLRILKIKRFFKNNSKYFYITLSCLLCVFLGIYFTYSKYFVSEEQEVIRTTVGDFSRGDIVLNAYINGTKADGIPKKDTGYVYLKTSCDNDAVTSWSNTNWKLSIYNVVKRTKCNIYFGTGSITDFDYIGNEATFNVPATGLYRLEAWGAQGGNSISNGEYQETGGKGGYAIGDIFLQKGTTLYVNVGGRGEDGVLNKNDISGGYNGGGISHWDKYDDEASGGGGGATHIAKVSGLLSTLENNKDNILIVAGGGGGGAWTNIGGAGGGITGNSAKDRDNGVVEGATQSSGYKFGLGGAGANNILAPGGGGGAGYYGGLGGTADTAPGSGGSGYIGNSLLKNKTMYCFNCLESSELNTKTVNTTCADDSPTENCSKQNNGYVRISQIFLLINEYYVDNVKVDELPSKEMHKATKVVCENGSSVSWNEEKWVAEAEELSTNDTCKIYFEYRESFNFDYTGNEIVISLPYSGFYKLEVWGGQGGNSIANNVYKETGGYGSYASGKVSLSKGDKLYINIAGRGQDGILNQNDISGGYNGGGISHWDKYDDEASGGGGGATHIAKVSGLLSNLENTKDNILIIAGGGGGGSWTNTAGSGGGITGNSAKDRDGKVVAGATQTSGYKFGLGGAGANNTGAPGGGGGAGYYGGTGGSTNTAPGGGGSGYIGNSLLSDKAMYCYNCTESSDTDTKTITTTCVEETPTENCAKKGNGYVKITYLNE